MKQKLKLVLFGILIIILVGLLGTAIKKGWLTPKAESLPGSLAGEIYNKNGDPLGDMYLLLNSGDSNPRVVIVTLGGRFIVPNLNPGLYQLKAVTKDGRFLYWLNISVNVGEGEKKFITLIEPED